MLMWDRTELEWKYLPEEFVTMGNCNGGYSMGTILQKYLGH